MNAAYQKLCARLMMAGVPDARFDAAQLYTFVTGRDHRLDDGPTAEEASRLQVLAERRAGREPLQYQMCIRDRFVSCRIATMVMDQVIIWAGVSLLGPHVGFAVANAKLWAMGVKLFSQVIVILSNYIFSKVLIFKKK